MSHLRKFPLTASSCFQQVSICCCAFLPSWECCLEKEKRKRKHFEQQKNKQSIMLKEFKGKKKEKTKTKKEMILTAVFCNTDKSSRCVMTI